MARAKRSALDYVDALPDNFLSCKSTRHAEGMWEIIPDDGGIGRRWVESNSVARITRRCTNCAGLRLEIWNKRTGVILADPQYRPPKGYRAPKGAGLKIVNYRQQYMQRRLYER
jgi:hypothetical protein